MHFLSEHNYEDKRKSIARIEDMYRNDLDKHQRQEKNIIVIWYFVYLQKYFHIY